jgi:cell division protein FtsB
LALSHLPPAVTAIVEPAMPASPSPEATVEERTSSRPLLILLIAVCTLLIVTYAARLDERDGIQEAIVAQQALNEQAIARSAALQQELTAVTRDSYIDQVARTQLGMGKEGDVVIVAVAPAPNAAPAEGQSPARPPTQWQPIWRQWLILFTPDS